MEYVVWTLTVVLTLVGLAGVVVPLLPGTTLILVAMVVHKLLLPEDLGWTPLAWIGVFWLFSVVFDFAGVLLGTRLFGGTKWGMAGASGGAVIGMFFSLPALILGTILGAVAAEKFVARRTGSQSLRSGAGAAIGFVLSTVSRLACAFVMIALFVLAVSTTH